MSEKMTFIELPGAKHGGLSDLGDESAAEMILKYRAYAEILRERAEEIEAAADFEFHVFTAYGPYVQRNKKVLQEGRKPKPTCDAMIAREGVSNG